MPRIKGKTGFPHSEETKRKIGLANRNQIFFFCDYCGKLAHDKPSAYKKKKLHFCNQYCYSEFRKNQLTYWEQPSYKGVRKINETKQVYHRKYCKNHPENISHLKARRYALKKGAKGSHTLIEWKRLKKKYNNKCAKCGKKGELLTKDHIVPLSKGGNDYIVNIQPLCSNCNSKKYTKISENQINFLQTI